MIRFPLIITSFVKYPIFHLSQRTLSCLLPGLQPFEESYVRKQVSIILNHEYKSFEEEKALVKEYTTDVKFEKGNNFLFIKRICSLMDEKKVFDPIVRKKFIKVVSRLDSVAKCKEIENREIDITFCKIASTILKIDSTDDLSKDKELFPKKTKDHIENLDNLLPIEELYITEELNYKTFSEELKSLKFDLVMFSEQTNLLRNLYIVTKTFKMSLDTFQENTNSSDTYFDLGVHLKTTNALEVLIQLNVYDKLLLQDVDCLTKKKIYLQRLIFSVFYPTTDNYPFYLNWEFSPILYHTKLFTDLGFKASSIRDLYLTRHTPLMHCAKQIDSILNNSKGRIGFRGDFLAAEKILSQRNSMVNWSETDLSSSPLSDIERLFVLFDWEKNGTRFDPILPSRKKIRETICTNFGEKAHEKLCYAACFIKIDFFQIIYINLTFLENLGFTNEQITIGIIVLVYPHKRIESMIKEIDEHPEHYPGFSSGMDWRSDPKALVLVSYYLEKSRGFKSVTMLNSHKDRRLV